MSEEATNASEEISVADETSLPESAEQSETQETVEASEAESEEAQPRKPTAKDRIDELTRLRREAEREAEYWRSKAMQAPQPQPQAQSAPKAEEAPDPESYEAGEFDTRYIKDLARWEAKQEVAEAMKTAREEARKAEADRQWQSKLARASEKMPDFEEKVMQSRWDCTAEMADALRSSDKGDELAYHLATNTAEAARISRLSPSLQLMELGKLEAKLSQPQPKTVTSAPTPIPQARGTGGKFQVNPDTDDFAAFDKAYGNGST